MEKPLGLMNIKFDERNERKSRSQNKMKFKPKPD